MKSIICKNCDSQFEGTYCPHCSQKKLANYRLNLKSVIHEFFNTIFNFDKGLLYTFWNLLKRPHFVAQSFIDGKRKRFTSPVQYFVISTIIQALVAFFAISRSTEIPSPKFYFLSEKTNQNIEYWGQLMTVNYPITIGIISTIVWTILIYLLFKKSNYNFTEILVSSLYFYGTIFILINLISIIYNPLAGGNLPMNLVSMIGLVYMLFAYLQFFKNVHIVWRVIKIGIVFLGLFLFRMLLLPLSLNWLSQIN